MYDNLCEILEELLSKKINHQVINKNRNSVNDINVLENYVEQFFINCGIIELKLHKINICYQSKYVNYIGDCKFYFIKHPFGSQKPPDFILLRKVNNLFYYIIHIECKSSSRNSNKITPVWNCSIPNRNLNSIYILSNLKSIMVISGMDIIDKETSTILEKIKKDERIINIINEYNSNLNSLYSNEYKFSYYGRHMFNQKIGIDFCNIDKYKCNMKNYISEFEKSIQKEIEEIKHMEEIKQMKQEYRIIPAIEENWSISKIAELTYPDSWKEVFEKSKYEFEHIDKMVGDHYFPSKKNLFRAFHLTPLDNVKVVIIGQDPYHQMKSNGFPRAQGLSFSVSRTDEIPVSLTNIFEEIKNSYPDFVIPHHGDLSSWARQGVLLLNSALTVKPHQPGSHGVLWHGFITRVFEAIRDNRPKCIFVLWGNNAKDLISYIPDNAVILETSHPSGFSANKGFFGCGHFKKINEILKENGQEEINWSLD